MPLSDVASGVLLVNICSFPWSRYRD